MDVVTMLRDLWRHRLAVIGVVALAGLAGILVLYQFSPPAHLKSRKYHIGLATAGVLVDTPSSQVAALSPEGAGDLGARADLLSRLMVQGTLKARIARVAGLDPRALYGVSMSAIDSPGAQRPPRGAPLLTTQVVNSNTAQLPLIQIEAQATDAASAARLADAAVVGLRGYIDEQAAGARVPNSRRVRITRIGATQAELASRGPKNAFALAASMLVLCLGCAVIIGLAALVRAWRAASSEERWPVNDRSDSATGSARQRQEAAVSSLRDVQPAPLGATDAPSPLRPADGTEPPSDPDFPQSEHLRATASRAEHDRRKGLQRRRSAS